MKKKNKIKKKKIKLNQIIKLLENKKKNLQQIKIYQILIY